MNDGIRIIKGTIPVILSVPHAVPHVRPDYPWDLPKGAERGTDLLGHRLRNLTGAWMILATTPQERDPNWFADSPYKVALGNALQNEGIALVVDIHGAAGKRVTKVDYDYYDDPSLRNRAHEYFLLDAFRRSGFGDNEIQRYDSHIRHPETISQMVTSTFGVPAFQIEIDPALRMRQHPRYTNVLSALQTFISAWQA